MKRQIILLFLLFLAQSAIIKLQDPPADSPPQEDFIQQDPPAQDALLQDILLEDSPVQDIFPEDAPVQETPQEDPLFQDLPAEVTPEEPLIQDSPTQDGLQEDTPLQDPPAQDPPAQDMPLQELPAQEAPVQDPLAEDLPADTPVDSSSQYIDLALKSVFQEFKSQYSRLYSSDQENYRLQIFAQNYKEIQAHNANPSSTYEVGVNQFTDLTQEQFLAQYTTTGLEPTEIASVEEERIEIQINPIDWRSKLNPIKHQGNCASCWAFAVNSAIEANYFIQKKKSIRPLSEQQLVDCFKKSCQGALPSDAFNYIQKSGITLAESYPYTGVAAKCKPFKASFILNAKTSHTNIQRTASAVAAALAKGPVSVILDCTTWKNYKSGVFNGCNKDKFDFNHAVTIVGIQKDNVWIIRNSWGANYGEKGYMRLAPGNSCGLLSYPQVPNIA